MKLQAKSANHTYSHKDGGADVDAPVIRGISEDAAAQTTLQHRHNLRRPEM